MGRYPSKILTTSLSRNVILCIITDKVTWRLIDNNSEERQKRVSADALSLKLSFEAFPHKRKNSDLVTEMAR